jgi:hypothetical protein
LQQRNVVSAQRKRGRHIIEDNSIEITNNGTLHKPQHDSAQQGHAMMMRGPSTL